MHRRTTGFAAACLAVIAVIPAIAVAADPDWKAVEQALGKTGRSSPATCSGSACLALIST